MKLEEFYYPVLLCVTNLLVLCIARYILLPISLHRQIQKIFDTQLKQVA